MDVTVETPMEEAKDEPSKESSPPSNLQWDEDNPLHAEMPTPSNTLSMVGDATQEAEGAGYRADGPVRLLYCQSYLIDSEGAFDDAQTEFNTFISGVDGSKYSGEVVAFYVFQHKNLERANEEPLKYICLHTLLLAGLLWEGETDRPQSFVVHQHRTVTAPHQTVSNTPEYSEPEGIALAEEKLGDLNLFD